MDNLNKKKFLLFILFFFLFVSCKANNPITPEKENIESPTALPGVIKGLGISPEGFPITYDRWGEFMEEVGNIPNGGVMFNGSWRDDLERGSDSGKIPQAATTILIQSEIFGFTPIIVFGWRSDETTVNLSSPKNAMDNWTNESAKEDFEKMLQEVSETYQPPYIFLGNESDAYFDSNPEDYDRWIEFYNQAYNVIKAASPTTIVGPIFQYERMSGNGGLNGWIETSWGALEAHSFDKVDIIGITLYPWLGVKSPTDIPQDYLKPLIERIGDIPIAITETGWPADSLGGNFLWESSPDAQVEYLSVMKEMVREVDIRMLNWLHLYPMQPIDVNSVEWQLFGSLALYDHDGNSLPIKELWIEYIP